MRNKKSLMVLGLVLLLAGAGLALAQPGMMGAGPGSGMGMTAPGQMGPRGMGPGHGGRMMMGRMFDLGLSDQQIKDLMQLRMDFVTKNLSLMREQHTLMQQQRKLFADPTSNKKQISANTLRLGEIKADLQGKRIDMRDAAMKVLTDEQRKQLGDDDAFPFGMGMYGGMGCTGRGPGHGGRHMQGHPRGMGGAWGK